MKNLILYLGCVYLCFFIALSFPNNNICLKKLSNREEGKYFFMALYVHVNLQSIYCTFVILSCLYWHQFKITN